MTLRHATVDDAKAIAEFQTACWREAYVGLVSQDYLDSVGVGIRQQRWATRVFEPAQLWVFEGNQRAIAFYTRNDFTPDGESMTDPETGLVCIRLSRR